MKDKLKVLFATLFFPLSFLGMIYEAYLRDLIGLLACWLIFSGAFILLMFTMLDGLNFDNLFSLEEE